MTAQAPRTASVRREVSHADSAAAWGEEFPPAASTPFVLGVAETACHRAVEADLDEGQITVGTRAVIEHLHPSPIGATLVAQAVLTGREGARLRFAVEVLEGEQVVARVEHTRAVVDRARILGRLQP
jgi:fluoroacetyl-CoA thioesterase